VGFGERDDEVDERYSVGRCCPTSELEYQRRL
jgi:hypothetical protein